MTVAPARVRPPAGRALAGVCGAVLDLDAGEADGVAAEVSAMTQRLPATARVALAAGVGAVDLVALARTGRHLAAMEPGARARFMRDLARWPGATDLVDLLKVPVLLAYGSTKAAPTLAARLTVPPARPDAPLDVTPSRWWPSRTVADVVVVGSGAGGAVVARALARSGASVVVVEEGRRFGVEEFRSRGTLERFGDLYRDGGATVALGRPPVILPLGRGVGGTTLVNSGTCYRTPLPVLVRWRDRHGLSLADPDRIGPVLDEVEAMLQVAPVPLDVMGANGASALRGAANLGWSAHPLRRNAPGCAGMCQCAVGCPTNAKFGVHLNALPDACGAGARIVSEARVERVLHGGGRATGVRLRRPDGSVAEILAPVVVVAAGATETPPLLRRSGLGRHPALGRNLAVHPAVSAGGWFDEPVEPTRGVLQSAGIDQLHESAGILIEATATPPGMGSMLLPGTGRELADQVGRADHLATLGAMIADAPAGRVIGARRPVMHYALTRGDGRRLVSAIGAMGRVLFAAGATSVVTGIRGFETVADERALDEALAHAHPARLHVAAFHPTGTAAMGADAPRHPVDASGRLRGVDGVWVADASVLPTCPEVNPQVTIMAMAASIAAGIDG